MPKQKVILPKRREANRAHLPAGRRGPKRQQVVALPDYGPPERWQHTARTYELTEVDGTRLAAKAAEECVLDALLLATRIDDAQHEAGMLLRKAYIRAKVEAPRTARYSAAPRQKAGTFRGFERNAREEAAYKEWRAALLAVPLHSVELVVTVCCCDIPPRAAQLPVLRETLQDLARYYRL